MAEEISVDTGKLRGAAAISGGVGDRIGAILTELEGVTGGDGTPWGNDSFGKKFADGANGYVAARENLTGAVGGMAKTFNDIEAGQSDAANELEVGEIDNQGGFQ
ncbi:hypothetical protein [Nocardia callitridis]|uniref:WXG100 family type VII secretion target n=1 Tax=Nocardia callitridis TaxID=648753 RepID=A0ABP9KYN8_9NOCA